VAPLEILEEANAIIDYTRPLKLLVSVLEQIQKLHEWLEPRSSKHS